MTKYDIYLIWGKDQDGNILRYYGSTSNFIKRKSEHKTRYKKWIEAGRPNNKKQYSSFFILDNGDWKMEKIDEIDGERWQARKLEGEYQKNNNCVNVRKECRTKKEWYEDNREKMAELNKQYQIDNKDKLAEYNKKYRADNKDKIADREKQYRADNKDKITQYYNDNKDKLAEKHKEYYKINKDKINEKHNEWVNNNKDKMLKKQKQYRADNKDKIAEWRKQHYNDNKQAISKKNKEKITCECGIEISNKSKYKHRESKKHINFISNNELNV
jgi:hypothetical protein